MPKAKLHYTSRQRLLRRDVGITLSDSSPLAFQVDKCSLDGYSLPPAARVYIEAYRQMSYMRFPCGIVSDLRMSGPLVLGEFDSPEGIKFRIKVTDPANGQLLADLDGISDPGKDALLSVKPEDIGEEVFSVDFTDEPLLLISDRIPAWKEMALDPVFASLVYPSVLRLILTRILLVEVDSVDLDDSDDWRSKWLLFAKRHPGTGGLPDDLTNFADVNDWIDGAVSAFAKRNKAYDRFIRNWHSGEAS